MTQHMTPQTVLWTALLNLRAWHEQEQRNAITQRDYFNSRGDAKMVAYYEAARIAHRNSLQQIGVTVREYINARAEEGAR
jgi:hypothetical protein